MFRFDNSSSILAQCNTQSLNDKKSVLVKKLTLLTRVNYYCLGMDLAAVDTSTLAAAEVVLLAAGVHSLNDGKYLS